MKYTLKEYVNAKFIHNTPGNALLNLLFLVATLLVIYYIVLPLLVIMSILFLILLIIAGLTTAVFSPIILVFSPIILIVYLCRKQVKNSDKAEAVQKNNELNP